MIKIKYPKQFKKDVKAVYPDNKALHKLVKKGSEDVVYHLTDGFQSNKINVCDKDTAEVILYQDWVNIYNKQAQVLALS